MNFQLELNPNIDTQEPKLSETNPLSFRGWNLYLDSENEGLDTFFNSIYKFLSINAFTGERAIIPSSNIEETRSKIQHLRSQLESISEASGLYLELAQPLILPTNTNGTESIGIRDVLRANRDLPRNVLRNPTGINFLQTSPILTSFANSMPEPIRPKPQTIQELEKLGQQSLDWNNKTHYIEQRSKWNKYKLPSLIATKNILFSEFIGTNSFEQLQNIMNSQSNQFYVKSAVDAGGEVGGLVTSSNFADIKDRIQSDGIDKGRDYDFEILVQEVIETPEDSKLPPRIGINYNTQTATIEQITNQIYSDEAMSIWCGCQWSKDSERLVMNSIGADKLQNMIKFLQESDYEGPAGVDYLLNNNGEYLDIGDLNPRGTGSETLLRVRQRLESERVLVDSITVLNNCYTGNLDDLIAALKNQNTLFTKQKKGGVLPIPSSDNKITLAFINTNQQAIDKTISGLQCNKIYQ